MEKFKEAAVGGVGHVVHIRMQPHSTASCMKTNQVSQEYELNHITAPTNSNFRLSNRLILAFTFNCEVGGRVAHRSRPAQRYSLAFCDQLSRKAEVTG